MRIAIITGASSGIGEAFARHLDTYNLDMLWLVARRNDRLQELQTSLSTKTQIFPIDITDAAQLSVLQEELERQKPEVLYCCNNAGSGLNGDFRSLDRALQMEMVNLNCRAVIAISYMVVPFMPPTSYLLITSSIAGLRPLGAFAVYGATKAFATSFSVALSQEVKQRGITVTAITPGSVATEFQEKSRGNSTRTKKLFSQRASAEEVVKQALQDAKRGKSYSIYGFSSKIISFISPCIPAYFAAHLAYTKIYPEK